MDEHDHRSVIIFYTRDRYYHTMQRAVLDAMAKYTSDVSFRFFNGLALVLDGARIQEGIRELTQLQNEYDFGMAVTLALMYAHKRCHTVDKEELIRLDAKLKDERKKLNANSAYYSGLFLFMSGKIEKAKEYADKALRLAPEHADALSLKGWSEVHLGNTTNHTLDLFNKALRSGKHLDASLGQVRYHQLNNDFDTAIGVLNRLGLRYPNLIIPLVEKMKTHLSNWHWDNATEMANRILNAEPANLEALKVKIMVLMVKDGNYAAGANALQYLFKSAKKIEPSNGKLFLQLGQLYSTICGRDARVLDETFRFVEHAVKINASDAEYLTELGYQAILQYRYKDAVAYFKSATKINDSSINALCGLTFCHLMESGVSEQVAQQLEFLTEIQGPVANPLLQFMSAKLQVDNHSKAIALLSAASEAHFKNLKALSYGPDYMRLFNPDFLLQLVHELLSHSPVKSIVSVAMGGLSGGPHSLLLQCANILDMVVKACPGLVEAAYQLALVQYLSYEKGAATLTLNRILTDLDPSNSEAHLLLAQIYIEQKQYQRAGQSLEICLSHSFKVRENPMYHLLQGIIQKNQQQYEDAMKSFMLAMNLCGVSATKVGGSLAGSKSQPTAASASQLTLADRLTLYLEVIGTHQQMNQNTEAFKLLDAVTSEFADTSEEGRLMIAMADLYLQQGNHAKAIELLKKMLPSHLYYMQAKMKMAYIYLNHRKDRLAFAQCFRELVANCLSASSYLMLGDAMMSIQEPDDAIEAYREALRQNPCDTLLSSKLGRAYVRAHQYHKAIAYYQEAIESPENYPLQLDLAELYLKLKQYQNAEDTLSKDLNHTGLDGDDVGVLQMRTKKLLLLARVREKAGQLNSSLQTLKHARDNQLKVEQRLLLGQKSTLSEQNKMLSKICVLMAEQSMAIRDNEQMVHHYKEALKYAQGDTKVMASLARIYMQLNQMNECQAMCAQIFQLDPNNETALVMMADLSFRRIDFESAAYHFSQLLLNQPTYWTALARMIEVMRRSGTLTDAAAFLQRAEDEANRNDGGAGQSYCKGLYEWYRGNPNSALRLFNYCRRDAEWGQQAIYNMIEICLNPDGDLPSELGVIDIGADDLEIKDSRVMALRTAERLLSELQPRPGVMDNETLNHRLLENFLLLASRQKSNVEKALQNFTAIASQDEYREHVGAIYGMAATYVVLKQNQRAKNQLKRVAKNAWVFEEAEYLEKCWLLLADLYITAGKYELAMELLKRVLQHNKSCTKANELCGIAAEKEPNYRAAAASYDSAWRYCGKSKPNIGYKLAFTYMKNKRYADAIDVCQQVLKLHPDYPSIRKEILDKCRNNLKS
ncbi:tetratricopeptide repeat protein 21B-like [Anopheles bellator]|uniref:tetratricopeptide repeat protein 21B-like n=1 Tax=Anopheles bellator TaxID=139047 RepID=UPI0026484504|nr:tetratricopeptide repeat protein 21B-like [Anopheles bellator]